MEVFSPGQRLAERYRLVELIGTGGMSHVWRAVDEVLGRQVAVKTLDAAMHADPLLRTVIRREARAAASVAHPNVTQVYDFGEEPLPDGGAAPYLVMELLVGQNLADRLGRGPLPWPEAVAVGADVAGALAAAHRLGVIHRDIKPANVMLTEAGAKVVDFGIAAVTAGGDDEDMAPRAGTPAYLAPEVVVGGGPGTAQSDMYALGALLQTALTGSTPLVIHSWAQAILAHERGALPAPILIPDLPHEVRELVARCLANTPWTRPGSEEASELLARWSPPVGHSFGYASRPGPAFDLGGPARGRPAHPPVSPAAPPYPASPGPVNAASAGASGPVSVGRSGPASVGSSSVGAGSVGAASVGAGSAGPISPGAAGDVNPASAGDVSPASAGVVGAGSAGGASPASAGAGSAGPTGPGAAGAAGEVSPTSADRAGPAADGAVAAGQRGRAADDAGGGSAAVRQPGPLDSGFVIGPDAMAALLFESVAPLPNDDGDAASSDPAAVTRDVGRTGTDAERAEVAEAGRAGAVDDSRPSPVLQRSAVEASRVDEAEAGANAGQRGLVGQSASEPRTGPGLVQQSDIAGDPGASGVEQAGLVRQSVAGGTDQAGDPAPARGSGDIAGPAGVGSHTSASVEGQPGAAAERDAVRRSTATPPSGGAGKNGAGNSGATANGPALSGVSSDRAAQNAAADNGADHNNVGSNGAGGGVENGVGADGVRTGDGVANGAAGRRGAGGKSAGAGPADKKVVYTPGVAASIHAFDPIAFHRPGAAVPTESARGGDRASQAGSAGVAGSGAGRSHVDGQAGTGGPAELVGSLEQPTTPMGLAALPEEATVLDASARRWPAVSGVPANGPGAGVPATGVPATGVPATGTSGTSGTPGRRAGRTYSHRVSRRRRSGFALIGTGLALAGVILISIAAGVLTPRDLRLGGLGLGGVDRNGTQSSAPVAPVAPPSPTPDDPSTPTAAMTAFESEVATALNDGRIDASAARDLNGDIRVLRDRVNRSSDISRSAQAVQRKLGDQVGDGDLDMSVGAELSRLLDLLMKLSAKGANG